LLGYISTSPKQCFSNNWQNTDTELALIHSNNVSLVKDDIVTENVATI